MIRYRGLVFDSKDHPEGIGTLVVASDCHVNCRYCFNQHLKRCPVKSATAKELLDLIKQASFTKYIVLAGLEWVEQNRELYELLDECNAQDFNTILYTHFTECQVRDKFPKLLTLCNWIKFGLYDPELKSINYTSNGIPLSSTNQYIKQFK